MREKINIALMELLLLVVVFLLSATFLNGEYLFGWVSHNWPFYLFLCGVSLLMLLLGKVIASVMTTFGITIGLFIGQYLGDFLLYLNQQKITPEMNVGEVSQLNTHYGFFIWVIAIGLFAIVGWLFEIRIIRAQRRRLNQ